VHEDALAFRRHDAPEQARALAAVVAQDVDGSADLATGFCQGLALVARHVSSDGVGA
jgi:hypothetical protein